MNGGDKITVTAIFISIFSIALQRIGNVIRQHPPRPDYSLGLCLVGEFNTRMRIVGHDPIADLESNTPFEVVLEIISHSYSRTLSLALVVGRFSTIALDTISLS